MNRVVHFELGAVDTARAVEFYKSFFGWEAQNWGGPMEYWLMKTGSPSELLVRLQENKP